MGFGSPILIYEAPKATVSLNPEGLTPDEIKMLSQVAPQLFAGSVKEFLYALDRCTFFAEHGYPVLVRLTQAEPRLVNPRIEGCDDNPFDQHYWLATDLTGDSETTIPRSVVFDPIFGVVGLSANYSGNRYYDNKRIVPPNTPSWEGGVRIKTMSI